MRPFEVPQVFNGCPSCPLVMCEPDTCNFPADSCGARPPLNGTECPFGQTPFYPLSCKKEIDLPKFLFLARNFFFFLFSNASVLLVADANACRKCHIQRKEYNFQPSAAYFSIFFSECRGPCPDLDCSAAKCSPTEVARTTPQLNEATGCPLCPLHVRFLFCSSVAQNQSQRCAVLIWNWNARSQPVTLPFCPWTATDVRPVVQRYKILHTFDFFSILLTLVSVGVCWCCIENVVWKPWSGMWSRKNVGSSKRWQW